MSNKITNRGTSAKTGKAAAAMGRQAVAPGERSRATRPARAQPRTGTASDQTQEAFCLVATELPVPRAESKPGTRERSNGNHIVRSVKIFGALLQKAGPYLLLEILLPGGTLFALCCSSTSAGSGRRGNAARDLRRRARASTKSARRSSTSARLYGIASLWRGRARERDGLEALAIAPDM